MALVKCSECGKEISSNAKTCPSCGAKNNKNDDNVQVGIKIICFLFPIIGVILYIVNVNEKPNYAKTCLIFALLPFIVGIVLVIVMSIGINLSFSDTHLFEESKQTQSYEDKEIDDYEKYIQQYLEK